MPQAICPECGNQYFGWALLNPKHQRCSCGCALVVINNDQIIDGQTGEVVELE